jgi:hypothetical protein
MPVESMSKKLVDFGRENRLGSVLACFSAAVVPMVVVAECVVPTVAPFVSAVRNHFQPDDTLPDPWLSGCIYIKLPDPAC